LPAAVEVAPQVVLADPQAVADPQRWQLAALDQPAHGLLRHLEARRRDPHRQERGHRTRQLSMAARIRLCPARDACRVGFASVGPWRAEERQPSWRCCAEARLSVVDVVVLLIARG
jgi:hypothetical protein